MVGDKEILARRDLAGVFAQEPLIVPNSDDVHSHRVLNIDLATRLVFIVIGRYSIAGIFDENSGSASVANIESESITARLDMPSQRATSFGETGSTDERPVLTNIVDDSCSVRGDTVQYCWTMKHHNGKGIEISESRGCVETPTSSGIDCTQ